MITGRRRVCIEWDDELEARDEIEVDEVLRLRRERSDDEEFDRGAAVGITTPDCFIFERENLGALLARFGSIGPRGDAGVVGMTSAHRPLGAIGFGPLGGTSEVDDSFGAGSEEKSLRCADDHMPLSLAARLAMGRSRSMMDRPPRASWGDVGGLRRPPMPTTQLLFLSAFCMGPSSSTC